MKKCLSIVFGLLILAACGSDTPADPSTQQVTYEPTATSVPATEVPEDLAEAEESAESDSETQADESVVEIYPKAIVSLSPTATEMLFAGDRS